MKRVSFGSVASYLMGAAMLGLAIWLSSDWHWGIRAPVLFYLSVCTLVFPLAKRPADLLIGCIAFGAPIQITGLMAWLALVAIYVVAWVAAPLFAPIGYLLLRGAQETKARLD